MRPNTVHYVLTVSNSITFGRHLYPRCTIQSTIYGMVHTFVLSTGITNTSYHRMQLMLYRVMAMWAIQHQNLQPFPSTHVPDVYTTTGFMDFISLGKYVECSHILNHEYYGKFSDHLWREQREMATVRWRFRKLLTKISTTHVIVINDKYYSPYVFYARALVEFAAAIYTYKVERSGVSVPIAGCTPKNVSRRIDDMMESNYPELTSCLADLVEEKFGVFYWTGPDVILRARQDIGKNIPLALDFEDRKIYSPKPASRRKGSEGEYIFKPLI